MKGILALEDGSIFYGISFGAKGTSVGEVCFNTSMTGYQEILTDPSYRGQIINFTYPLIGNYGIQANLVESDKIQVRSLLVREACKNPSHYASEATLSQYVKLANIPALENIDTRSITLRIRERGVMRGCITTEMQETEAINAAQKTPSLSDLDLVSEVATEKPYLVKAEKGETRFHLIALDFGIKKSILEQLTKAGFSVKVINGFTPIKEILAEKADGIFLSNGPGDPASLKKIHQTVQELAKHKPIFGICLGCQILAHSFGGKTKKLKFGHRGGNHPVKDMENGKIAITAQNHGFAIDEDHFPEEMKITQINLNDKTIEGIQHKTLPIFAVQYHPEAGPGPNDANYLFYQFAELIQKNSV